MFSTHPKTRKLLEPYKDTVDRLLKKGMLILSEPFGFVDYIELQKKAYCTISDSGTIMEESSLLGFPAVTIRDSYERLEGMDEGVMVVSHWDCDRILDAMHICVSTKDSRQVVRDYKGDAVAEKVLKIMQSMLETVQCKIYKKK